MIGQNRAARRLVWALSLALLVIGLAGCGGDQDEKQTGGASAETPTVEVEQPPTGNAGSGETLFASRGCADCHAVDSETVIIGPSLAGVAVRAGQTVAGLDAAAYLRQSLVEPNAYLVESFQQGVMPAYATLNEQELTDLVAYLLTLDE